MLSGIKMCSERVRSVGRKHYSVARQAVKSDNEFFVIT